MRVRRRAGAAALTAFSFCAFGRALAQIADNVGGVAPFQWGPVQFFPVVATSVDWTDNLYYTNPETFVSVGGELLPVEPVSTLTSSVSPSFLIDVPFGQSRARAGYAYRYTDYSSPSIPSNDAHFFAGDLRLAFSNGLLVQVRDDFQKGVLDTESFDPGGAITFSGQKFKTNTTALSMGYQGKRTQLLLTGYLNSVNFPADELAAYYDTDGWSGELSAQYAATARLKLIGYYSSSRTRLERPLPPTDLTDKRIEIENGMHLGADVVLSPASSFSLRVGRPRWEYISFAPEKFRALVSTASFRHVIPAGIQYSIDLTRNLYPAVFLNSNRYTDERIGVSVSNDARARVVVGTALAYYVNRYPTADLGSIGAIRRLDKSFDGSAWIGYRAAERMEWRFYVRTDDRKSNVRGFGYHVNSIGATFTLGE